MLNNRQNSKWHFENIMIRGRSGQNSSMIFHVIFFFFNALDFVISFVPAAWELDNDGAYLNPLKKQLLKQDPFYLNSSEYLAGRSLKKDS